MKGIGLLEIFGLNKATCVAQSRPSGLIRDDNDISLQVVREGSGRLTSIVGRLVGCEEDSTKNRLARRQRYRLSK